MKILIVFLCLSLSNAFAQKMHVKVIKRGGDTTQFNQVVPGITTNNGNSTVNCGAYGNTANCVGAARGTSLSIPAHEVQVNLNSITMMLLLPDNRTVFVFCVDNPVSLNHRAHYCKGPAVDELEAKFSGAKVKLTWGVGLDGKKKVSETYIVGHVDTPPSASSAPAPPKP